MNIKVGNYNSKIGLAITKSNYKSVTYTIDNKVIIEQKIIDLS